MKFDLVQSGLLGPQLSNVHTGWCTPLKAHAPNALSQTISSKQIGLPSSYQHHTRLNIVTYTTKKAGVEDISDNLAR